MPTFYHVTFAKNLKSIFEEGLTPRVGERSEFYGEDLPRVYLFPCYEDCEHALGNWLGEAFDEDDPDETCYCLSVEIPEDHPLERSCEWEYASHTTIPSEWISIHSFEG